MNWMVDADIRSLFDEIDRTECSDSDASATGQELHPFMQRKSIGQQPQLRQRAPTNPFPFCPGAGSAATAGLLAKRTAAGTIALKTAIAPQAKAGSAVCPARFW